MQKVKEVKRNIPIEGKEISHALAKGALTPYQTIQGFRNSWKEVF